MKRVATLVFLSLAAVLLPAQQIREQPPLYPGTFVQVPGVFVTPIAGVPFTATVMIRSTQALPDGSSETRVSEVLIARDSRGRIRNERHATMPEGFKGTPPLVGVPTFDPATRIACLMNPATMIARQRVIPPPHNPDDEEAGQSKDLGYTTLNGMQAKGKRITREIPAVISGTGKTVTVTDEFWYSEELHMNLLEEHTDIRGGKQSLAILSIKREEPPSALFEVPAGYKVVDLTPPPNAPVRQQASAP